MKNKLLLFTTTTGGGEFREMGPTKTTEQVPVAKAATEARPRRGSLPDLKSSDKTSDKASAAAAAAAAAEKKVPTGPRANPLYKTRLCMNFQSTGSCPYTEKCQFAHGVKELEKWENWRNAHKSDDAKRDHGDESSSEEARSRSQSFDKMMRSHSSGDSHDFGSPQSLSWDVSTPLKGSSTLGDENTPLSGASNFSLWSSLLDDIENDRPPARSRPTNRTRAATYDCTYDNISQLRDAPTLFNCPPILPNFGKHNGAH